MTTTKRATMAALKDVDDRERPQEFKPCSTCRYKFLFADTRAAGCLMFGNHSLPDAREKFCGRHGDAWRAKEPTDYAAVRMVDRVLG